MPSLRQVRESRRATCRFAVVLWLSALAAAAATAVAITAAAQPARCDVRACERSRADVAGRARGARDYQRTDAPVAVSVDVAVRPLRALVR